MRISPRRPKTEFHFGFEGPPDQAERQEATVEEILESLSRHSQLNDQLRPREVYEPYEETGELLNDLKHAKPPTPHSNTHGPIGRYGFGLMLAGGVLILGLYGTLRLITNTSSTPTAAGSLLALVLNDPIKLGLLGILCLVPIVMLLKRRSRLASLSKP